MMALKDFLNRLGCETMWSEGDKDGNVAEADLRSEFLLNTSLAGIEEADVCLLIGSEVS